MPLLSRDGEDKSMTRSEIEYLIEEHIVGRNAERNRKILHRRLIDGICFEPLAEEFGLSVRQVKTIVYKGIDQMPIER